ncbi:MAG: PAS domain-containing protein [Ignavibacteriaceae bacterium]|jgi:PAS domain S-box-containing protein
MVSSVNIEHLEIIKALVGFSSNAFLVIDQKGTILYSNKKSIEIFSLTEEVQNFLEIFDPHELDHIEDILENLKLESFPIEKQGRFRLHTKEEFQLQFQIIQYLNDGNDYYFLQFEKSEPVAADEGKILHFSLSTAEIPESFSNPDLLNVINEVQSNYPFTFLGKNKLQVSVNKLKELFWLKDNKNNYLLVNQNFADKLGLRISQIEGRPEEFFLPSFNLDFYNSMETFLKTTGNTLFIKGIPVKGFTNYHDYQSVVIPLLDADNKVIAVLGMAQQEKAQKFLDEQNINLITQDLINSILLPVCILDGNSRIEKANKPFFDLVGLDAFTNKNITLNQIFAQSVAHEITAAIESNVEELSIAIPLRNGKEIRQLQAKIKKLNSDKVNTNAYFLVVEFLDALDNFEVFLKTRGKMFDVLIKSLPDPILIYDAENLRFLEANDAAISLYGYSREEFLQMDLTDLYSPEDIQTLLDRSDQKKKNNFSGPFNHKKKDGSTITVEIFKDVFTYENKEAHFTVIKNISDKLDKEKEYKLYKSVFEGTDQLIAVTDNSGFITFVNQNLVLFVGLNKTSLVGNSLVSLFSDNDRGNITSKIFSSQSSDTIKLQVEIKNAQKAFIPAEVIAIPNLNAKGVTDSYNILIKMTQKEEKEIVIQTVEKKSGTGLAPSQLSTIFHEILTPINVMLGFLQEIKESLPSPTTDQKEALNYIQENQQELMGTMNAIAEYSTLLKEDEESQSNTFAVLDLFEKIKQEFSEEPINKKNSLITNIAPLWLEGDERKYKMFFGTIASICAKISDENHFYFSIEQTEENEFVLSVRDDLSRISEKLLFALEPVLVQNGDVSLIRAYGVSRFAILTLRELMQTLNCKIEIIRKGSEPFEFGFFFPIKQFSVEPVQTQVPEAKSIAETKHVTQEVVSRTTQGKEEYLARQESFNRRTTFISEESAKVIQPPLSNEESTFKRRRTIVEESPKAPPITKVLELQNLSCLYIEDQVDSQILFKVQMKELGDIKFAVSFEEALPLITSQSFDFIVMDINLQGEYNGLDALKMIHQMPGFQSLPIIAVTAYVLPGDKDKFIAAGFTEFISKPIFREKMIEALEKIFLK